MNELPMKPFQWKTYQTAPRYGTKSVAKFSDLSTFAASRMLFTYHQRDRTGQIVRTAGGGSPPNGTEGWIQKRLAEWILADLRSRL